MHFSYSVYTALLYVLCLYCYSSMSCFEYSEYSCIWFYTYEFSGFSSPTSQVRTNIFSPNHVWNLLNWLFVFLSLSYVVEERRRDDGGCMACFAGACSALLCCCALDALADIWVLFQRYLSNEVEITLGPQRVTFDFINKNFKKTFIARFHFFYELQARICWQLRNLRFSWKLWHHLYTRMLVISSVFSFHEPYHIGTLTFTLSQPEIHYVGYSSANGKSLRPTH